jgi:hypothetical protein
VTLKELASMEVPTTFTGIFGVAILVSDEPEK